MGNPTMQASCDITLEQAYSGCSMTFTLPTGQQANVDIPAGVDHGQVLRVPGGAGAPNPDFPPGDLNIVIRLRPHAVFHRQGMTLLTRVPVDLIDIICGCEKEVTTISGERITVTIPENSNPESTVVVTGQGMNRVGGTERGSLIVHLHAQYPTFDAKQLRALKKLQKKS
jgi:molecular chaperone DnaJ